MSTKTNLGALPSVKIDGLGTVVGKDVMTMGNPALPPKTYHTFRNIPYAMPITQEKRFTVDFTNFFIYLFIFSQMHSPKMNVILLITALKCRSPEI
jgi:hypothetical protein